MNPPYAFWYKADFFVIFVGVICNFKGIRFSDFEIFVDIFLNYRTKVQLCILKKNKRQKMKVTTPHIDNTKKELKQHVSNGELDKVFDKLEHIITDNKTFNQIIAIRFSYNEVLRKCRSNTLSIEEQDRKKSTIVCAILSIIDLIDEKKIGVIGFGEHKSKRDTSMLELSIKVDIDSIDEEELIRIISTLFRISRDGSLKIQKIKRGSIILEISLSKEAQRELILAYDSGELSKALNYESLQIKIIKNNKAINIETSKKILPSVRSSETIKIKTSKKMLQSVESSGTVSMTAKKLLQNVESQFDPSKVPGADTIFHFILSGENGGEFTVVVKDDECTIREGLTGEAKCTIKSTDEVFENVMTGKMNPAMAVMGGKLVISNVNEMMKFAKPFGLI